MHMHVFVYYNIKGAKNKKKNVNRQKKKSIYPSIKLVQFAQILIVYTIEIGPVEPDVIILLFQIYHTLHTYT